MTNPFAELLTIVCRLPDGELRRLVEVARQMRDLAPEPIKVPSSATDWTRPSQFWSVTFEEYRATPKRPAKWRTPSAARWKDAEWTSLPDPADLQAFHAELQAIAASEFLASESRLRRRIEVHDNVVRFYFEGETRRACVACWKDRLPGFAARQKWTTSALDR